jgi:hypothetical protein
MVAGLVVRAHALTTPGSEKPGAGNGAYDVCRKDGREVSMTIVGKRVTLTAIALSIIPLWYGHREHALVSADQHRPLMATRIYTGGDGMTHVEETDLKMGPVAGAPASVEESPAAMGAKSYVVRLAPGFTESWHNADVRRYVIPVIERGRRRCVMRMVWVLF